MLRNKTHGLVAVTAVLLLVLSSAACAKYSYSSLRSNYHFEKANRFYIDSQYRKAISEYEMALKYNPKLMQAHRFLGESYKQLYKPGVNTPLNKELERKTLDTLKKAIQIDPNNKDIIYSLGDMYDKLRRFPDAEKLYLRILDLEPTNMNNYYVLADFYKRYVGDVKGVEAKAVSMYLRRIELDPENPQGYAYVANYYETMPASAEDIGKAVGNYDTAYAYWQRRITLNPNSAEAWLAAGVNRWGRAYRFQNLTQQDRFDTSMAALKAVEKAQALDPEYPEPYSWLSVIYKSLLSKLEPEKEARYTAEAQRYIEKFQDLRKRAAERKKLEEELKKN